MFRNCSRIDKSVRLLTSVGFFVGLAALPTVADAQGGSTAVPVNSPTAAENQKPAVAPQPFEQGMGMNGMMGMCTGMGPGKGMPGMGSGNCHEQGMAGNGPYHIGAMDFFLDQADKLKLTPKQTTELTEIKRNSLAKATELHEKIARLEGELFTLTSGKSPNDKAIASKVKQIEAVVVERRLGLIKSVGKAKDVLDENQRKTLGTF